MSLISDKFLLQKLASYIKISLETIRDLEDELDTMTSIKTASEKMAEDKLDKTLRKVAKSLQDSDFINTEEEIESFLKQAKENPTEYLATLVQKVCKSADVSQIGHTARVAARPKQADFDPVMARAFGHDRSSLLDS